MIYLNQIQVYLSNRYGQNCFRLPETSAIVAAISKKDLHEIHTHIFTGMILCILKGYVCAKKFQVDLDITLYLEIIILVISNIILQHSFYSICCIQFLRQVQIALKLQTDSVVVKSSFILMSEFLQSWSLISYTFLFE